MVVAISTRLWILHAFLLRVLVTSTAEKTNQSRTWLRGIPTPLPLLSKTKVSRDTDMYKFGLIPPSDGEKKSTTLNGRADDEVVDDNNDDGGGNTLGIGVCSCILVSPPSNRSVIRPYTPISGRHDVGSFTLLVKRYPHGVTGKEFDKLKTGDTMLFWQIPKNIKTQYPFGKPRTIIMLAAGTGITPMYQALLYLFGIEETTEKDWLPTKVVLCHGSRTTEDAYLCKEMDEMKARFPSRLEIIHALSDDAPAARSNGGDIGRGGGGDGWRRGKIDHDMIRDILLIDKGGTTADEREGCDRQIWVCGPPSFYEDICGPRDVDGLSESCILRRLGCDGSSVVKF